MSYPPFDTNSWEGIPDDGYNYGLDWTGSGWYYDGNYMGASETTRGIKPKTGSTWSVDYTPTDVNFTINFADADGSSIYTNGFKVVLYFTSGWFVVECNSGTAGITAAGSYNFSFPLQHNYEVFPEIYSYFNGTGDLLSAQFWMGYDTLSGDRKFTINGISFLPDVGESASSISAISTITFSASGSLTDSITFLPTASSNITLSTSGLLQHTLDSLTERILHHLLTNQRWIKSSTLSLGLLTSLDPVIEISASGYQRVNITPSDSVFSASDGVFTSLIDFQFPSFDGTFIGWGLFSDTYGPAPLIKKAFPSSITSSILNVGPCFFAGQLDITIT